MKRHPAHRGFMVMDAVLAMGILIAVMGGLALGIAQYRKASDQLLQRRQALYLAQQVLHCLQNDAALPDTSGVAVTFTYDEKSPPLANGLTWLKVQARLESQTVELTGPVNIRALTRLPGSEFKPGAKP